MPRGVYALALLGSAFACGPSLTSVHEGTVRFEHCNRLDLDQRVVDGECRQCWQKWLAESTYGQPRDRIDYARRRARALSNGNPARPVLTFDERSSEDRQFYLVVPGPTSVHAPPPPIATVWHGADAGAPEKAAGDLPPSSSCAEACRTTWGACNKACSSGKAASNCSKCGTDYSTCMKSCFD